MNEKLNQDRAVEALQKAAKSIRAPKLDESILVNAAATAVKTGPLERFGLVRKLAGFSLAGAAASVVVAALVIGSATNPQPTFTLEMGANAPQGANKSVVGGSADAGYGSSAYWLSPISIDFVAADDLSVEAGTGSIYELVNNTTAKELSAAIKRVLGIDGAFVDVGYDVETPEGTESIPFFTLATGAVNAHVSDTNGALSFTYSNGDAWITGECIKEESSPEKPDVTYCVENAPVKGNLPSDKAAFTQALEVFNGLGFDTTAEDITLNRAEDSIYAFAPIKVDGKSTGLSWDISWGNTGKISGVNGYAVDAVKVADVSTLSAKDTVKRMNDYRWMASGSAEIYQTATSAPSLLSPYPYNGTVKGKRQTMLIVKATKVLGIIYDAKGKMWVVPSYAMYAENDNYPLVYVSVEDGVLKLQPPIVWPQDDVEPRSKTGDTPTY